MDKDDLYIKCSRCGGFIPAGNAREITWNSGMKNYFCGDCYNDVCNMSHYTGERKGKEWYNDGGIWRWK